MVSRFEVPSDGAILRGETDGFGLPVVFLHDSMADRRMWTAQMRAVAAAGYHVMSYDRRGHGETEAPDEPFTHVNDLEIVLDKLSIHAAILVGCGSGGALAIDFAIEHPNRSIGLVLVGTAISGDDEPLLPDAAEGLMDAADYALERRNFDSANRIHAHLWLDGPLEASGRVDGPARELFLAMNGQVLRNGPPRGEEEADPAIDVVATLTLPVLLMVGELDFPHIVERHSELSDELETAFAVVIEGAAHLPNLERPELFDSLLLQFLEALTGEADEDEGED
ncbi:MAG: alpha/beta fold hydrolase [Devosia sp.]